jgi:hypothetical protein
MIAVTMTQATDVEGAGRRELPHEAKAWRARLVSSFVFGGVCVAMIGAGILAAQLGDAGAAIGITVGAMGLYGIPAALLLGWIFGPRAGWGSSDERPGFGFKVGALAVVIGDLTVVLITVVLSGFGHEIGPEAPGIAVLAFGLGLLIFGLPALVVTVPASWIWMSVLRRIVIARAPR